MSCPESVGRSAANRYRDVLFGFTILGPHTPQGRQRRRAWLHTWTDEMDLPSVELQRDCHKRGGGMRSHAFCSCDLDLHPMTLIYKLDPKILKAHPHTNNELPRSRLSKVGALQTDRRERNYQHNKLSSSLLHLPSTKYHFDLTKGLLAAFDGLEMSELPDLCKLRYSHSLPARCPNA